MRLFNLMKSLFGRPEETPEPAGFEDAIPASATARPLAARPPAVMPHAARVIPVATRVTPGHEPAPLAYPAPTVTPATTPTLSTSSGELHLPLSVLVSNLPVELQGRVITEKIATTTIVLPLERILPQLAQGSVRVMFGEIRQSAPDAFYLEAERDVVEVILPLAELVSRLAPALAGRRPQRRVQVPSEITSPFGANGLGLSLSQPAPKPAFTSPRGAPSVAPVPPAADARARGNVNPIPAPQLPPRPVTPGPKVTNGGTAIFHRNSTPLPAGKSPAGNGGNGNGGNGTHGRPTPTPTPAPAPAAPQPALLVPLARLCEAWPDAVQVEIGELNLGATMVSLPGDQVEAGLKRGKVSFTWRTIRACIKPATLPSVSAHDNLALDLPLGVIAPLFLSLKHSSQPHGQRRVAVDEQIPNLFFGFPQPEAAVPAPVTMARTASPPPATPAPVVPLPEPADTNYFIWDDDKETGCIEGGGDHPVRPTGGSPGTTFMSRKATPNEIVARASVLEGVYGAMVALPDGLLVAAKLDPSLNGEAVAALIPQMYSKLSGCTKELRMGELNNLHFTVGKVPWKIFRVNGLFFAAYGAAGEPLPSLELAKLAADLDYRKAK